MNRPAFRLDTKNRKLLGVCAGLGHMLRIDPTFVRVAFVAVPLMSFVTFWQALVAYVLCGLVGAFAAGRRPWTSDYKRMGDTRRASIKDLREKMDTNDRRMMAVDHHLNSNQNDALAREIEALRTEKA
jgi:phage shock protein PspC (stress-responsive transcriptional regulator)